MIHHIHSRDLHCKPNMSLEPIRNISANQWELARLEQGVPAHLATGLINHPVICHEQAR